MMRASVIANPKRNRRQHTWNIVIPGIVIAAFHVEFPVRITKRDRKPGSRIHATCAAPSKRDGFREDTSGIAGITPPRINRKARCSRWHHEILIHGGTAVIPAAADDRVRAEAGPRNTVVVVTIIGCQSIQVDVSKWCLEWMDDKQVGWQPAPHEFAVDRILAINVISSTSVEVTADTGKLPSRIQRRRWTSANIEVDPGKVLGGNHGCPDPKEHNTLKPKL